MPTGYSTGSSIEDLLWEDCNAQSYAEVKNRNRKFCIVELLTVYKSDFFSFTTAEELKFVDDSFQSCNSLSS